MPSSAAGQSKRGEPFVVIMAGGGGTRLWPASRRRRPKQFLPLLPGGRTLLGATVERLAPIAPAERTLIVTAASQVDDVLRCAPSIPRRNIVVEPEARNTAPCVGLAAVEILRRDPDAVMAVIPSDQYVADVDPYRALLTRALGAALAGRVVTIGIKPTAPETGFGYIEAGKELEPAVREVARFVEKPVRATAESYLATGRYYWNSGMFFFRASHILELIGRELPELSRLLDAIARDPAQAPALYPSAPSISIDYGVMERLRPGEVAVVHGADFGWSDVGSWAALETLAAPDANANAVVGEAVVLDGTRNLVYAAPGRVVAAVGVSDLVIVATDDAVLVLPRERAQDVREVVKALESSNKKTYL